MVTLESSILCLLSYKGKAPISVVQTVHHHNHVQLVGREEEEENIPSSQCTQPRSCTPSLVFMPIKSEF